MEENVAHGARRKAGEENTSSSKTRLSDEYWRAYERWKQLPSIPGIDAEPKLTREELHERR